MVWLNERPEHANSDLGLYLAMGVDVGLDRYGGGHRQVSSAGATCRTRTSTTSRPSSGRNGALIMKSGVYDGKTDTHKLMDQSFTREDVMHAWYDEAGGGKHPFDRTTTPIQKNTIDHDRQVFVVDGGSAFR